jgi:hypothetical protein
MMAYTIPQRIPCSRVATKNVQATETSMESEVEPELAFSEAEEMTQRKSKTRRIRVRNMVYETAKPSGGSTNSGSTRWVMTPDS